MAKIVAVCLSEKKGTAKHNVGSARFIEGHGIEGDAHAGNWHRQVSLLSFQKIEDFRARGGQVTDGDFGENLVVDGIDFSALPVGTRFRAGSVLLEMTQIGKECHHHCAIFHRVGDCIMPREGVFARVLVGGVISAGDEIVAAESGWPAASPNAAGTTAGAASMAAEGGNGRPSAEGDGGRAAASTHAAPAVYRAAVLTLSDKAAAGERVDESGPLVCELIQKAGYVVRRSAVLPDDRPLLESELIRLCDTGEVDLVLTTGGTGLSPRDITPEATLAVASRLVPGIAEAMRAASMAVTKRAMLSRGIAAIRKKTLIVNLPGSPKAARENLLCIIDELKHGLDILTGRAAECAVSETVAG
ncbi:MAG: MOSC domain-containing protein, partial [Spirochaetaceae bacterium]|nr:MOSC domain-containing protein [Spirochaetaceae bacterium]